MFPQVLISVNSKSEYSVLDVLQMSSCRSAVCFYCSFEATGADWGHFYMCRRPAGADLTAVATRLDAVNKLFWFLRGLIVG